MFCPSCGAEAASELSYCKRCGAQLGAARKGDSRPKVAGLIWAVSLGIALVTVGGFAVVFGFLIESGARTPNALALLLGLLLLVVLAVDYLLARQLSRLLSFHLHTGAGAGAGELRSIAQPPAQLEAPRQPAFGDLEQATRTLDHAPGEREPR